LAGLLPAICVAHILPSKLNYSHGQGSRYFNGTRKISCCFHGSSSLDRHYTKQVSFSPHLRAFHFSLTLWKTDFLTTCLTGQEILRLIRNLVHKKPPVAPVLSQHFALSTILMLSSSLYYSTPQCFLPLIFSDKI